MKERAKTDPKLAAEFAKVEAHNMKAMMSTMSEKDWEDFKYWQMKIKDKIAKDESEGMDVGNEGYEEVKAEFARKRKRREL